MPPDPKPVGRRALTLLADSLTIGLGVAAVGYIDYATGAEVQVVSLYFVPLAFAAWRQGAAAALITSVLSTVVWLAALYANGARYAATTWAINSITQTLAFVAVSLLVSTLGRKLRQEGLLRRTDTLTGLQNRQAFLEQAGAALWACRRHGHSSALAFIDLDNFKNANDHFGHAHGDALLRTCGAIVAASVRGSDVAARLGGDEFVIFLPRAGRDDAIDVSQRIVDAIASAADFRSAAVTASVGVVVDERSTLEMHELLGLADSQMYRVKQRGKNGVAV